MILQGPDGSLVFLEKLFLQIKVNLSSHRLASSKIIRKDHGLAVVPTREWQDNLSKRLAFGPTPSASTHLPDEEGTPAIRRRRLNDMESQSSNWNSLYTIAPEPGMNHSRLISIPLLDGFPLEPDDLRSTAEGMGQLSLDENQEVCQTLKLRWRDKAIHSLRFDSTGKRVVCTFLVVMSVPMTE